MKLTVAPLIALLLAGCHSGDTTTEVDAGASPVSERSAMRAAEFEAAITGLDFATGRIVVTEPNAVPARDRARVAADFRQQGDGFMRSNNRAGAIKAFATAFRTNPADADAAYQLGRALIAKARLDYAEAAFRTALDIDARYDAARLELAETFARRGEYQAAIDELTGMLRMRRNNGPAWSRLAVWNHFLGNEDAARQAVIEARRNGTEPPAVLTNALGMSS